MTIALSIDGPERAPPVLMLHAIATSRDLWAPQIGPWSSRFRLIRVDLPGHGASPPPAAGADFPDYAQALIGALDTLGVRQAAVVGLSFGAMIGLRLAAQFPDRVSGLVMANCLVRTPAPIAEVWRGRISAVRADGMAAQAEPTLARWFTPAFAKASPLTVDWVRGLIQTTPPPGFCAAAEAISHLDQSHLLGEVRAPALVVTGLHDQAAPPAVAEAIRSGLPQAELAALDAAHLSNVEQPVAFTESVGRFLGALQDRPA